MAFSCAAEQGNQITDAEVSDLLELIPSGANGRFVLTVRNDGPGTVAQADIEQLIVLLELNGATSIVSFKGLPTIIVNTDRSVLEKVARSGRLDSIHVDAISSIQKE